MRTLAGYATSDSRTAALANGDEAATPTRWWQDRVGEWRDVMNAGLWLRFCVDRFFVVPVARFLPLPVALHVADFVTRIYFAFPSRSSRNVRAEIAACTGAVGADQSCLAARRFGAFRREIVYNVRLSSGRERPDQWELVEENGDWVRDLVASRRPFVLASGHFLTSARTLRYKVMPNENRPVAAALPRWQLSPSQLRRRLAVQVANNTRQRFFRTDESREQLAQRAATIPDVWVSMKRWSEAPRASQIAGAVCIIGGLLLTRLPVAQAVVAHE